MTDRFTLAAITVVAVLAATLTATTLPGWVSPALTWAIVYTGAVLGTARVASLPAGRVLVASALMLATTVALLLTAVKAAIEQALTLLAQINARGIDALSKEAKTA